MNDNPLDQFDKVKLSREAEAELAQKIKRRDETALNTLVMANMHAALLYSQRVSYDQIGVRDRISLCYQELTMSGRRFDPSKGRFFAFAKAGLRGRMKRYWSSLNTVRNAAEVLSVDVLDHQGGCLKKDRGRPTGPEDDREISKREIITGEIQTPDPEPLLAKDHWETIRRVLADNLSEQQWMILDLAYMGELNFVQIGNLLGITRSGVHAAHRKAIAKLRDGIAEHKELLL
jgi:RNA polymerase sigma factor (sigma-70 family)